MTIPQLAICCFLFTLQIIPCSDAAATTKHVTSHVTTAKHHGNHHTHHPHVTREPVEHGSLEFQYDHYCHLMVYKKVIAKTCFIYNILGDERHLIHTPKGLLQLEVQAVMLSANATAPYPRDDLAARSNRLNNLCPSSNNYTLISLN